MVWINNRQWDRLVTVVQQTVAVVHLLQKGLKEMADQMKDSMDALTRAVQVNGDRVQSMITLCQGLAQQMHAAAEDPAAVRALADQLNAQSQTLADAVVANTPGGGTGGNAGPTFETPPLTGTQEPVSNPPHPGSIPPPPPAPATSGMGGSGGTPVAPAVAPASGDQPSDSGSSREGPEGHSQPTPLAPASPTQPGPADTDTGTSPVTGPGSAETSETPRAGF